MANQQYVFVAVDFAPAKDAEERRARLVADLKSYGHTCHVLSSVWMVETNLDASEVFRNERELIRPEDRLIVGPVAVPEFGGDPWHALNAPNAKKCHNQ